MGDTDTETRPEHDDRYTVELSGTIDGNGRPEWKWTAYAGNNWAIGRSVENYSSQQAAELAVERMRAIKLVMLSVPGARDLVLADERGGR